MTSKKVCRPKNGSRRVHYVNVVGQTLRKNRKLLRADPDATPAQPITVRTAKRGSPEYGYGVGILDAAGNRVAELVYRPDAPLGCGAVVYLVCAHGVSVDQAVPAKAARAAKSVRGRGRPTGATA